MDASCSSDKYIKAVSEKRKAIRKIAAETDWSPIFKWGGFQLIKEIERKHGITCRRGKFSALENEQIKAFVSNYFRNREADFKTFINNLVTRKKQMASTVGAIFFDVAKMLNNGRPVFAVYDHMRRLYHPHNYSGFWKPEEDEKLKRLFAVHGPNWELIGHELNKLSINCRDRYKTIRRNFSSGPWSLEEVNRLKLIMAELTASGSRPSRGLWVEASERMKTRSMYSCFDKWTVLQYRSKSPPPPFFWTPFEDFRLITAIYESCVSHDSEIIWNKITDPKTSCRTPASCKSRWSLLKRKAPRTLLLQNDIDLILEYLLRELHVGPDEWEMALSNKLNSS